MNIALSLLINDSTTIERKHNKQLDSTDRIELALFNLTNVTIDKVSIPPYNRLFKNTLEYDSIVNIVGCTVPYCFSLVKSKIFIY